MVGFLRGLRARRKGLRGRVAAVLLMVLAVQLGSLVAPAYACGCGALLPGDQRMLAVDREASVVRWDGAQEQIVMRLTVGGDAERAAWIMPVPHRATVRLGDPALFDQLARATAPLHRTRHHFWPQDGDWPLTTGGDTAGPPPPRAAPGVGVIGRQRLGPFEVARLTATDPGELAAWYFEAANSGDLVRYIATFEHTLAVMQTREGLLRTAEEYVLDLAADGVVYGEVRYAPELNVNGGLSLAEVVETVQEGLAAGMAKAAAAGTPVRVGTLLCGMRMFDRVREAADLAVAFRDAGVVGFDIAGAEDGFPPADHLAAFEHLRRENVPFTIHAGEAHGLPSIHQALQVCGAQRIGHGVRITDDIVDGKLGRLAGWVRDRRVALEMCPTSNLQTGAATSIAEHPITALKDLGFRVTLNTDNRLVSGTTMTREMSLLVEEAGWTVEDLRTVTVNALKSAFVPFDECNALIEEVVLPGYAAAL
ncbi:adenosine deaminase [Streptomyces sp. MBT97]|nr:adenosine deaminase [Streptomyces sp. MBT97]